MSCKACDSQPSGLSQADCRPCTVREIARGPHFFKWVTTRDYSEAYLAQLRPLGETKDVHFEVKQAAKTLFMGAVRA